MDGCLAASGSADYSLDHKTALGMAPVTEDGADGR